MKRRKPVRRYPYYTRAQIREINAKAKRLRDLLSEFGANLSGFDPGVTANIPGIQPVLGASGSGYWGEPLAFSARAWGWLEPLLIELRQYRREKKAA